MSFSWFLLRYYKASCQLWNKIGTYQSPLQTDLFTSYHNRRQPRWRPDLFHAGTPEHVPGWHFVYTNLRHTSYIHQAQYSPSLLYPFFPFHLWQVLGVQLVKYDELECLIHGIHFINSCCVHEFYYWNNLHCLEKSEKVPYDFTNDSYPYIVVNIGSGVSILSVESAEKFSRISGTR